MATTAAMQSEDPWDWTVDEVVAALCDPALPFRGNNNPHALPDSLLLEQKLREHIVEGCCLLTDIDVNILKEDFGITAIGPRGHIHREILRLRRRSSRYLEHITHRLPDPQTRCYTSKHHVKPTCARGTQSDEQVQLQNTESTTNDEHSRTRPGLVPDVTITMTALEESGATAVYTATDEPSLDTMNDEQSREKVPTVAAELPDPSVSKASQRRIAPTFIRHLDQNHGTDQLSVARGPPDVEQQSCEKVPTVAAELPDSPVSKAGRKRVAPLLIHQLDQDCDTDQPSITGGSRDVEQLQTNAEPDTAHTRKPNEAYLGTKAQPVDDLFYKYVQSASKLAKSLATRATLDDEEANLDDFAFTNVSVSNGQRHYINSRMRHFLRQKLQVYKRGSTRRYGIRPYPDSLGSKHQPLSITIFETGQKGVYATRQDRAQWLSSSNICSSQSKLISDDPDIHQLPTPLEEDDGAGWDFLVKWQHATGQDFVHPVYGDSGSEGEYDLETWRLIEEEKGEKLPRPLGRSKMMKKVSEEEVITTIDKATERMIEDWKQRRLPRLSPTAWMLWSRSRRYGTEQVQISSLIFDVQHLTSRLDKLRKGIAKEVWISTARISRQCESMRRTINELEEAKWKLSTLQLVVRPEKPQKLQKQPKKAHAPESLHEKLDIEADSCLVDSSDGDLDGFVVDDDEPPIKGSDASIADSDKDDHRSNTKPLSADVVDLTFDSDATEPEASPVSATPAAHPNRSTAARHPSVLVQARVDDTELAGVSNILDLDEDSAYDSASEPALSHKVPELYETAEISEMDHKIFMERSDRKRLLIWILARVDIQRRTSAYSYICFHDFVSTQENVWRTLDSLRSDHPDVKTTESKERRTIKAITA
ncbi:MAG: hypothetical protein L6R39_007462, partial [Caloplaca ligustica]